MSECWTCKIALTGAWNLTTCGDVNSNKAGRYLGINGYMFYAGSPNWVYSYCLTCYKKEVVTLATRYATEIGQQIPAHQQQLDQITQQKQQITAEVTNLQLQKTQLTSDTTTLQQQKTQLNNELTSIQQAHQLANDISSLSQHKTQMTNDINSLQTQVNELKQHIEDILGTTGASQLQVVIAGPSLSFLFFSFLFFSFLLILRFTSTILKVSQPMRHKHCRLLQHHFHTS